MGGRGRTGGVSCESRFVPNAVTASRDPARTFLEASSFNDLICMSAASSLAVACLCASSAAADTDAIAAF